MPRSITNKQINPNELVVVKGKLNYSRLAKQIAGEALAQEDARRRQHGRPTMGRPFTTITIDQAQIVPKNPSQLTPTEIYVQESFYTSESARSQGGMSYTANNKSRFLPHIGLMDMNTGMINEIKLDGELDSGLDVIIVMRSFAGQQGNNGVSLDWVITNELRYYARGGSIDSILGLIGAAGVKTIASEPKTIESGASVPSVSPDAFDNDLPFKEPEPVQTASAPVMGSNPFSSNQPVAQPFGTQQPAIASPFNNGGGIVAHPFGN